MAIGKIEYTIYKYVENDSVFIQNGVLNDTKKEIIALITENSQIKSIRNRLRNF